MNPATEARKLVQLANDLGLEANIKRSNLSNSHYVTIFNTSTMNIMEARISNHSQWRSYYHHVDIEIGQHEEAHATATRTPRVLREIANFAEEQDQIPTILEQWKEDTERAKLDGHNEAAQRNAEEAAAAAQVTDAIREGGKFSTENIRFLIKKQMRSNGITATKPSITKTLEQVSQQLRQNQGEAVLTPDVFLTEAERADLKQQQEARRQSMQRMATAQADKNQKEKAAIMANAISAMQPMIQESSTVEEIISKSLETARTFRYGLEALSRAIMNESGMSRTQASKQVRRALQGTKAHQA